MDKFRKILESNTEKNYAIVVSLPLYRMDSSLGKPEFIPVTKEEHKEIEKFFKKASLDKLVEGKDRHGKYACYAQVYRTDNPQEVMTEVEEIRLRFKKSITPSIDTDKPGIYDHVNPNIVIWCIHDNQQFDPRLEYGELVLYKGKWVPVNNKMLKKLKVI